MSQQQGPIIVVSDDKQPAFMVALGQTMAFPVVETIWAEATRNPYIAAICLVFDGQVQGGLTSVVDSAKRSGAAAPQIDTAFAVQAIITIGIGLFKRRAHEADFDGENELQLALGLISAVLCGAARPFEVGPKR